MHQAHQCDQSALLSSGHGSAKCGEKANGEQLWSLKLLLKPDLGSASNRSVLSPLGTRRLSSCPASSRSRDLEEVGRWWIDIRLSDRSDDRQTRRQLLWCYSNRGLWTVFSFVITMFRIFLFFFTLKIKRQHRIYMYEWVGVWVNGMFSKKIKKKKYFYDQITFFCFTKTFFVI